MSVEMDKLTVEGNFLDRLAQLERRVTELEMLSVRANSIDEICDDLGVVEEGTINNLLTSTFMTQYIIDKGQKIFVPKGFIYFVPSYLEIYGELDVEGRLLLI